MYPFYKSCNILVRHCEANDYNDYYYEKQLY